MGIFSKSFIAALITLTGLSAAADETPVFVSCYADSGAHLQLIFDTAQTQFSYRMASGTAVEEFDSIPSGPVGEMSSHVNKQIPADQSHIVLTAQIVNGDAIEPIIDASVQVIFDRDPSGSLHLTSYSLYHLSQPYNLDTFMAGTCYVQ